MAITPLPTPPSRQDPANFADEADAFLGALPTFGTEANQLATDVNADAAAAAQSVVDAAAEVALAAAQVALATDEADRAETAADIAVGAANYQGDYDAGTTYQIGQSVTYLGNEYVAKTVNLGVTPVDGVNWLIIRLTPDPSLKEGQVLTTDGTDLTFSDLDAVTNAEITAFFSSGTWEVPSTGVYQIYVIGAGGAGGAVDASARAASGGGAGGFAKKKVRLVQGDDYTITIGAGGTTSGQAGGTTSIVGTNVSVTANGGSGGAVGAVASVTVSGGAGGTATGGDVNYTGGAGGDAQFTATGIAAGGGGAIAFFGTSYRGGHATSTSVGSGAGVGQNGVDNAANGTLGGGTGLSKNHPVTNSFSPKGSGIPDATTTVSPSNLKEFVSNVGGGGVASEAVSRLTKSYLYGGSGGLATNTGASSAALIGVDIGGGGGGMAGTATDLNVQKGGDGLIFMYKVSV